MLYTRNICSVIVPISWKHETNKKKYSENFFQIILLKLYFGQKKRKITKSHEMNILVKNIHKIIVLAVIWQQQIIITKLYEMNNQVNFIIVASPT